MSDTFLVDDSGCADFFLLLDQDILITLPSNECPRAFEQNSIKENYLQGGDKRSPDFSL